MPQPSDSLVGALQNGQLEYRMDQFDLAALPQKIIENVQGMTQTHNIVLEKVLPAQVYGDRDRIGQVLINMLTNAIKCSQDAGQVIARMAICGGNSRVSVRDSGIGISETCGENLF